MNKIEIYLFDEKQPHSDGKRSRAAKHQICAEREARNAPFVATAE